MDAASAASSSTKGVMENVEQPHVLAVDDNLIDRKLIEQLLINSSCKGNVYSCNHFLLFLSGLGCNSLLVFFLRLFFSNKGHSCLG